MGVTSTTNHWNDNVLVLAQGRSTVDRVRKARAETQASIRLQFSIRKHRRCLDAVMPVGLKSCRRPRTFRPVLERGVRRVYNLDTPNRLIDWVVVWVAEIEIISHGAYSAVLYLIAVRRTTRWVIGRQVCACGRDLGEVFVPRSLSH